MDGRPGDAGRPRRILRVIARLNIGGPARHTLLLSERLDRRGYDTLLVYGSPAHGEADMADVIPSLGIRARRLPALGRQVRPWADARALVALVRLMWAQRPEIVHTHTAKAGTLGRVAAGIYNLARARPRRCVVLHTYHGHVFEGYFGPLGSAAVRLVERTLSRLTTAIVVISQGQFDDVVRRFGVAPAEKVRVVPLGLDLDSLLARPRVDPSADLPRLRREAGFRPSDLVCGFVGRFAPVKDLPLLVRAFALARARRPDLRLLLVGDGECRSGVEAAIGALDLGHAVHLAGWQRDTAEIYDAIDVALLTSRNEGTPVALIEAMAAGIPVIALAVGGVRDVVQHGVTGWLVEERAPESVAARILDLASDPGRRAAFGREGRTVASRYGAARLVGEMDALYRALLAGRAPGGAGDRAWN